MTSLTPEQKTYIRNHAPYVGCERRMGFVRWLIRVFKTH